MTPNVVCWLWETPGYRSQFTAEHVNTARRMVARHFSTPHRFICVTDRPEGLDPGIDVVPAWNDHAHVPSPNGRQNPSCYRRLRAFAPDIAATFGERFVSIDIDVIITGDLNPLWNRPEDFVIWGDTNPLTFYNGSMFLLTAGARPQVWCDFDPQTSPDKAYDAKHFGSDQGWISYRLGPNEATWKREDGVYSFRNDFLLPKQWQLPGDARAVFFHGKHDPWSEIPQRIPWVRREWV